ncbi:dirigent protein 17-like [Lycium barbarum]|uniref:dirigent protein 17-like n=1 Tax=Lycium barbarum TaxID=112863 RepID=UPI00293F63D5|nr:dirigent protein 17-like [Lycium barbarum]XP_060176872.1 dirigent protein 17-like [Lycium barbarum]XP_060176873.1 dirigent protein 17-like [Lycium barbarum]
MDFSGKESDVESSLSPGVFELPGEPAVVINGLPPISSNADTFLPCPTVTDAELHKKAGFGQWLEGREVRKLFGNQYYYGKVTEFDSEVGWFRVKYEDGDVEDLEWHELERVLRPLDITIPLKTLAAKIVKRKQRSIQKSFKSGGRTRNQSEKKMTKTW